MSNATRLRIVDAGSGGLLVLGTDQIAAAALALPPNNGWGGSFGGYFVRRNRRWEGRGESGPLPKDVKRGVLFTSFMPR